MIHTCFVDKPARDSTRDPNEGIEDVAHLVEDALKHQKDGDTDTSSVSSSLIEGVVKGNNEHDVTDEIALPAETEPALLSHKLSESETHVISNGDHVTTMSVGGAPVSRMMERQESIEKSRHASRGEEDPRLSLRMDEEITLGQEEIM